MPHVSVAPNEGEPTEVAPAIATSLPHPPGQFSWAGIVSVFVVIVGSS